jgi:hypothetical protein
VLLRLADQHQTDFSSITDQTDRHISGHGKNGRSVWEIILRVLIQAADPTFEESKGEGAVNRTSAYLGGDRSDFAASSSARVIVQFSAS